MQTLWIWHVDAAATILDVRQPLSVHFAISINLYKRSADNGIHIWKWQDHKHDGVSYIFLTSYWVFIRPPCMVVNFIHRKLFYQELFCEYAQLSTFSLIICSIPLWIVFFSSLVKSFLSHANFRHYYREKWTANDTKCNGAAVSFFQCVCSVCSLSLFLCAHFSFFIIFLLLPFLLSFRW